MSRIKLSNKALTILAIATAAMALLVIAVAFNPPAPSDRLYTNMYIHGIPVGGLTASEADAALMQHFQPALDERTISFTHEGQEIARLSYRDLGIRLDFSAAVEAAREYGNKRNLPARIARIMGRPHKVTTSPALQFDPAALDAQLKSVTDKIQTPPLNAGFAYENGKITITTEKAGRAVDTQHITGELNRLVSSLSQGIIEMRTTPLLPQFAAEDLRFAVTQLGTFSTPIAGGEDARVRNVRRAAERIHNQVLYPGDVFSASAHMGTHLPASGYEAAIVLVRGEPVEDIGGGICQVVTTLYNAVLLAELTVVQRHNHSVRVSYAEYGFDATIAGDYYDLKFKNSTTQPILITSSLGTNGLQVSIYGYETRPPNRTIQFSSQRVDVIPPEPYKEVVDTNLAPGERIVTLESQMGYRFEVFKYVYVDGREVERIKVNTSSYRPMQGVVSVGQLSS